MNADIFSGITVSCPDRDAFVNRMLSRDKAVMPCLHGDGG
jgi:hypothetical protein